MTRRPAPPLAAPEPDWARRLRTAGRLHELVRLARGPVHVVHPETFAATLDRWDRVGRDHGVRLAIRFGKKANKSAAFATECARAGGRGIDAGVDVASAEEFVSALAAGNRGSSLVVTGPTHPIELILLAARHSATLAVATEGDLDRVCGIVGAAGERLDVLVRLRSRSELTRFGLSAERIAALVAVPPSDDDPVRLRGVSFHRSGHAIADRVATLREALPLLDAARAAGHPADLVSAGGGWPVDHIAPADGLTPARVWRRYLDGLAPEHLLPGALPRSFYPYGVEHSGERALDAALSAGIGQELVRRDLTLIVEPGRALCTGAGVSVFPVLSTEPRPDLGPEVGITVVDGTSFSLSEQWFESEFCPDPVLVGASGAAVVGEPVMGCAISGRSCLDSDLLSRRFVPLARRPVEGELLVYPDTAGYQMDSNESAFHEIPVPRRFVAVPRAGDPTRLDLQEDPCTPARPS